MSDEITENVCEEQQIKWKGESIKEVDTLYHKLHLMQCGRMGAVFFMDGVQRSMTLTAEIFAECLAVPAILECGTQSKRADILILGNPEGSVYEVLERSGVNFRMVHIYPDEECVKFCADFLPYGYDPEDIKNSPKNLIIKYDKFNKHLKAFKEEIFDMVIIDVIGLSAFLDNNVQEDFKYYNQRFYTNIKRILKPNGSVCTTAGFPDVWRSWNLFMVYNTISNVIGPTKPIRSAECNRAFMVACNTTESPELIDNIGHKLTEGMKYMSLDKYKACTVREPFFFEQKRKLHMAQFNVSKNPLRKKEEEFFIAPIC